jgi:2-iminobutanoate/2-iminopropanoate deaminase
MRKAIETDKAPKGPNIYSQAIDSKGTIYVAGQIHLTAEGKLIEGSTKEKLDQIMNNIKVILEAVNLGFNDVAKVTIYVTDMSEIKAINEIYSSYFNNPLPAREAICVKELPLGASIEISVIASK